MIDSAGAYTKDRIDMVFIGADGVVESGGIITYQIALVAHNMNKPVYLAAESYKFARLYSLHQKDLISALRPIDSGVPIPSGVEVEKSAREYTPPQYLTLLFTDLGVLTPSVACTTIARQDIILDACTILVHGFSSVLLEILEILKTAAQNNKLFRVLCTESRPDRTDLRLSNEPTKLDVPVKLLIDSVVACTMDEAYMVFVGADGLVESGVVNMMRKYQVALVVAHSMNRPVYVASEIYKPVFSYARSKMTDDMVSRTLTCRIDKSAEIRLQFRHPGNLRKRTFGTDLDQATNEFVIRVQPSTMFGGVTSVLRTKKVKLFRGCIFAVH